MHKLGSQVAAALFVSIGVACANAQTFYNLVGTDDVVLATVEFAELPATHMDIVGLSFTDAGEELFGLGRVYSGVFDSMGGPNASFLDDSTGGLTGFDANGSQFATAYDDDPPQSILAPNLLNPRFAITATIFDEDFVDELVYDFGNGVDAIVAQGSWQLVPEPSSNSVLSSGLLILLFSISRWKF